MSEHLKEISRNVAPGAHAALICHGAGWHQTGGRLRVPANVTLLPLPPSSQELNPLENVWRYLRETSSAPGYGTATRPSSMPARRLGTSSSTTLTASDQSAPENGRVSGTRRIGIKGTSSALFTSQPPPFGSIDDTP